MNILSKTSSEHAKRTLGMLLGLAAVLAFTTGRVSAQSPTLTWAPSSSGTYNYGTVAVEQTLSQQFTLTNSGRAASAVLTINLSTSPDFTIVADACSATGLGPGKSCDVVVQFRPTNSGQVTATLTASGRKPPATANLTLIGIGEAATRHIYWINPAGAIGRADIDGSHVNQTFITGTLYADGIAVDSRHIYWTTFDGSEANTIGRADLDGSNKNPNFVTGAAEPSGIAVDSEHIYWGNDGSYTIARADLDGSNFNYIHIGMWPDDPFGVAIDSQYIYWVGFNYISGSYTIGRANLDGSDANQGFITNTGRMYGVAVDAQHIYWTNIDSNTIGRADLDGSNVNQSFIVGAFGPCAVTADSQHIYWTNFNSDTIGRANLDGTNVNQNFVTGTIDALGVAVDSE
jgi:HYDIN/CFA65/VesB family protein/uncharacterized protein DUF5050